jgi:hypothetical protein
MNVKVTKPQSHKGLQTFCPASCCSNTAKEYSTSNRSANVTPMYQSHFCDILCKSVVGILLIQEMRTEKTHIKIFYHKWICTNLNSLKLNMIIKNAVCWVVTPCRLEEEC